MCMKAPWTVLAVLSLVGISLFSIYVAGFTSQGIMCSYVTMMPYFLPISFALGLLFGYAIPQITRKERDPKQLANLFIRQPLGSQVGRLLHIQSG